MTKYIIDEKTFDEIFSILKKDEHRWKRRAEEMKDFPERAAKYKARAEHISAVIDNLLNADEIEQ